MVGRNVRVLVQGADGALAPHAEPPVLMGVTHPDPVVVAVCVEATHPLGAMVTLVFQDADSGATHGAARLIYEEPCRPMVAPLTGIDLTLLD